MLGTGSDRTGDRQESTQTLLNTQEWSKGDHLDEYISKVLSPVEVQIFVRYRDELSGRVLDLGCGGGRVLAYLVMLGADAHGLDLAQPMVDHCARAFPEATVAIGDVRELDRHTDRPFDVVLAPDNLIDVFDDAERRRVIAGIRTRVKPGGLFIFSTHDLGFLDAHPGPPEWESRPGMSLIGRLLRLSPASLIRAIQRRLRGARNRRRLRPLQARHGDHAIVNDFPHDYSLLHYYIRRDDQERQLAELGFKLIECLAADGSRLESGGTGPTDSLYYVARPA